MGKPWNMTGVWAVIRTKGPAPYLEQIITTALQHLDGVVLVDNNETPQHQYTSTKLIYFHDSRAVIPMCSKMHSDLYLTNDNFAENSLASFYRNAFELAPKNAWKIKIDDDDAWSANDLIDFRNLLERTRKNSIVYFSGLNWLGEEYISAGRPICGGRDHFALGPRCKYEWINGASWEELILQRGTPKIYAGIRYIHLKFFGNSVGYKKDIVNSNEKFLNSLEADYILRASPHNLNFPLKYKLLNLISWRFVPNAWLGCYELRKFWRRTKHLRRSLESV